MKALLSVFDLDVRLVVRHALRYPIQIYALWVFFSLNAHVGTGGQFASLFGTVHGLWIDR